MTYTSSSSLTYGQWNWRFFIRAQAVAVLLLLSFSLAPFNAFWDGLDKLAFLALNRWLSHSHHSQVLWAYVNQHWFDLVSCLLLVLLVSPPGLVFKQDEYQQRLLFLISTMVFSYFVKFIWVQVIMVERISPSLLLEPAYLFPDLVPEMSGVKFASKNCFPGDHAAVTFSWMLFCWRYGRVYFRPLAVLAAIAVLLPRVVAGAHWLSDVMVGGFSVALFSMAWWASTPLSRQCMAYCTQLQTLWLQRKKAA